MIVASDDFGDVIQIAGRRPCKIPCRCAGLECLVFVYDKLAVDRDLVRSGFRSHGSAGTVAECQIIESPIRIAAKTPCPVDEERTTRKIDDAVKNIIMEATVQTTAILTEHRDILTRMAEELLEKETIVLDDIEKILAELRPGQYAPVVVSEEKSVRKEQKIQDAPVSSPKFVSGDVAGNEPATEETGTGESPDTKGKE